MKITKNIYSQWMAETQEKKYEGILVDFIIPMRQKLKLDKSRIIDVGVGEGWFEKTLTDRGFQARVIGIDIDNKKKERVEGLEIVEASGDFLPFKNGSFDMLISLDTIHLLNNNDELLRVVKDGGYILVSTFCNEHNMQEKRRNTLNSFPTCSLLREGLVGDPKKEQSYVGLFKKE